MKFDLAPFDTLPKAENGATVPLLRLDTGEPFVARGVALTFTVCGTDSDRYQQAVAAVSEWRVAEAARGGKPSSREFTARVLSKITVGWTGLFSTEGVAVPVSEEAALEIYRNFPAIADQIERFVLDRANFLPGSPIA